MSSDKSSPAAPLSTRRRGHAPTTTPQPVCRPRGGTSAFVLVGATLLGLVAMPHSPLHAQGADTLSHELRTVDVVAGRVAPHLQSLRGASVVSMDFVGKMPRILGNADPLHYAQMLPGVQTSSEYDAGLHIQGSDNSHNQLGIGGVPIYNATHLFGFFSVFNPTHYSSMAISKSATYPESPNRLGGVVDMTRSDTIWRRLGGHVSVGPMSSQATLRLPVTGRSSLTLSARAAYLNLLYSKWLEFDNERFDYFFHDYNLTYTCRPSHRDMVQIDAYYGGDDVNYGGGNYGMTTSLKWHNAMASAHWRHTTPTATWEHTAYITSYSARFALSQTTISVSLPSSISSIGYKLGVDMGPLKAGLDIGHHSIRPQSPNVSGMVSHDHQGEPTQHALEATAYAGWSHNLTHSLSLQAGVRTSLYHARSTRYGLDPTLSICWLPAPHTAITLSGGMKHQYIFKTGFSDIGLPTEFYVATGYGQPAQRSIQASLAMHTSWGHGAWRLEAEAYYKRLHHQVEYIGNVFDFVFDDYSLNASLISGRGHNWGASVLLERCKGRLKGWVAYSFGQAKRTYHSGSLDGTFHAAHERPHELNAVATYRLSQRWSLGASLVAASGTPYTRVRQLYTIGNHVMAEYGEHNGERLPPYARLDLSASYDLTTKHGRTSGINISLYNVTAHSNTIAYQLRVNHNEYGYRPFGFVLRVLPSINYYLNF